MGYAVWFRLQIIIQRFEPLDLQGNELNLE